MQLKKQMLGVAGGLAIWVAATSAASAATVMDVLPGGSSGWQTYSYTFTTDATIGVFLGVSDTAAGGAFSTLDIDNIVANETTDFTGEALPGGASILGGPSASTLTSEPFGGHGDFLRLYSKGLENTGAVGGSTGSLLNFSFSGNAGETFTFDWRFTAGSDDDFSFLVLAVDGGPGIGQSEIKGNLAQVGTSPVPVPAAAWLLGSAVASMGVFRRRRRA
jgi:hypothetical protein